MNCLHSVKGKFTKRLFKSQLHKLLLTVVEIENDYADINSLVLK